MPTPRPDEPRGNLPNGLPGRGYVRVKRCVPCDKKTGHKRALGFGTFVMFVITMGFWVMALPFYPSRCVVCGT